jgi:hypothetical protein
MSVFSIYRRADKQKIAFYSPVWITDSAGKEHLDSMLADNYIEEEWEKLAEKPNSLGRMLRYRYVRLGLSVSTKRPGFVGPWVEVAA